MKLYIEDPINRWHNVFFDRDKKKKINKKIKIKNLHHFLLLSGFINAKFKMRQYVIFRKP